MLVARFAAPAAAERAFAELRLGYQPGAPYTDAWRSLFQSEAVDGARLDDARQPDTLMVLGASLLAHASAPSAGAFAELRALAWKRGATVLAGGAREPGPVGLLFAIRAYQVGDAAAIVGRAPAGEMTLVVRGRLVLGYAPLGDDPEGLRQEVRVLAGVRPLEAWLWSGEVSAEVLMRLAHAPIELRDARLRLFVEAEDPAHVAALVASSSSSPAVTRAGRHVVVDAVGHDPRAAAIAALRAGAFVSRLDERLVVVRASLPSPSSSPERAIALESTARALAVAHAETTLVPGVPRGAVALETPEPAVIAAALCAVAEAHGLALALDFAVRDPLAAAVATVLTDVLARR